MLQSATISIFDVALQLARLKRITGRERNARSRETSLPAFAAEARHTAQGALPKTLMAIPASNLETPNRSSPRSLSRLSRTVRSTSHSEPKSETPTTLETEQQGERRTTKAGTGERGSRHHRLPGNGLPLLGEVDAASPRSAQPTRNPKRTTRPDPPTPHHSRPKQSSARTTRNRDPRPNNPNQRLTANDPQGIRLSTAILQGTSRTPRRDPIS